MTEDDIFSKLPDAVRYTGMAGGYLAAAAMFLRQWLSQAKVDRSANDANVATIARLQTAFEAEQARADQLMHEREAMVGELGSLRAKVELMSKQLEELKALLAEYRDETRKVTP